MRECTVKAYTRARAHTPSAIINHGLLYSYMLTYAGIRKRIEHATCGARVRIGGGGAGGGGDGWDGGGGMWSA